MTAANRRPRLRTMIGSFLALSASELGHNFRQLTEFNGALTRKVWGKDKGKGTKDKSRGRGWGEYSCS